MQTDDHIRLLLAMDAVGMATWDSSVVEGRVDHGEIYWSPSGAALLGISVDRFWSQAFPDFLSFVHPDDVDHVKEVLQSSADKLSNYELQYRVIREGGAVHWLQAKAHVIANGSVAVRTLGLIWDVTEIVEKDHADREARQMSDFALASIVDGVIITDAAGQVRYLNKAAEDITGWAANWGVGTDVADILTVFDESTGARVKSIARACLLDGERLAGAPGGRLITRDGRNIALDESAAPIWSTENKMLGSVTVFRDVTHQRNQAAEICWQASHDPLTGLLNRREFENRVAAALHSSKMDRTVHTLLFIDLDRFKLVNDTAGHSAGDALLQHLTSLLQKQMRDSDVLARLGGDELGILLSHCALDQGQTIAEGLRESVQTFVFNWEAHTFTVGASIGMVAITQETTSVSDVLAAADEACYVAKAHGRNRVHVHHVSDELLARRHRETGWVARLNEAMQNARLRLYSMPIHALKEGVVNHHEILLRLVESGGKETLPDAFVPAAERYNLMPTIDRWVIEEVCHFIAIENAAGSEQQLQNSSLSGPKAYAINLSGLSVVDESLPDFIERKFFECGVNPTGICFEITETAVIANMTKAQNFMRRLSKIGCRFSLDDFGSGLSSFAYLKSLPVQFLKIDGLFIKGIADDVVNRAMVEAIHRVGEVMGMQTIAEWVEDSRSLDVVRAIGIDFAQGYAIGRPKAMTPAATRDSV